MKRIIVILSSIVLILLIGTACKLFLTGFPVDGNAIFIEVEELGNQINIHAVTPESGASFTNYKMHSDGTTLYITMNKVLPSPVFRSGEKFLYLEKTDFTDIYFCGKHIWSTN